MTYIGAGTYVMKSAGAGNADITIDGEEFFLLGGVYHLVIVKEYGSYVSADVTTLKVPNGTLSISVP